MRFRCYGRNPEGVVKVYGWGNSRSEALEEAEAAARQYIRDYDLSSAPFQDWSFHMEDRTRKFEMVRGSNMYIRTIHFGSRRRDL
jgi:hypothetical protein